VIADRFSFADIGCSSARRDFFRANLLRAIPRIFCLRSMGNYRLQQPTKTSGQMPPAIEKNSIAKWLAFRCYNDAIVFPPISGVRFRPMQLERRDF
jgi:hypothetical protein